MNAKINKREWARIIFLLNEFFDETIVNKSSKNKSHVQFQ